MTTKFDPLVDEVESYLAALETAGYRQVEREELTRDNRRIGTLRTFRRADTGQGVALMQSASGSAAVAELPGVRPDEN